MRALSLPPAHRTLARSEGWHDAHGNLRALVSAINNEPGVARAPFKEAFTPLGRLEGRAATNFAHCNADVARSVGRQEGKGVCNFFRLGEPALPFPSKSHLRCHWGRPALVADRGPGGSAPGGAGHALSDVLKTVTLTRLSARCPALDTLRHAWRPLPTHA